MDKLRALKVFFERDWSMEEKMLILMNCILGGLVIGFIFSPFRKGITVLGSSTNLKEDEE